MQILYNNVNYYLEVYSMDILAEHIKLSKKIQDNLLKGKYILDSHGHYDTKLFHSPENILFHACIVSHYLMDITEEDIADLEKIANCEQLDHWFEYKDDFKTRCELCGEKLTVLCDGITMKFVDKCSYKKGDFSVSIPTPSKKIVIENDLISLFVDRDTIMNFDLNTSSERQRASQFYAKHKLGLLYVSNKPLHLNVDNKTIVEGYNDRTDIFTDLWWVSFADHDEFLIKFNEKYPNKDVKDIYKNLIILEIDNEKTLLTSYLECENSDKIVISIT